MAYKVIMPKAGMAMETGTIVRWLKKEGDTVDAGEMLLEIETDKVNMEVEAMDSGFLLKILAREGEEVPVVQTIGYIGEPGETVLEEKKEKALKEAEKTALAEKQELKARPAPAATGRKGIFATPAAKRIAREEGMDLEEVYPSGSRGQIKAADVTAALKAKGAERQATARGEEDQILPHSAMRKVIAGRMLKSHLEIPPVTQNCIADVTDLMAMKESPAFKQMGISLNDFIMMAAARTLREQPHLNAQYTQERLIIKKHVHVGMAVALHEGLVVPVIRDADTLSLEELSKRAKDLSTRAREGRLAPYEYAGGTFTVSNLGMMGVTSFTPIINQPEVAILGVCAVRQTLLMNEQAEIQKRMVMELALTYDHRCIDGAQAAIFSNRVAGMLGDPLLMMAAGSR